MTTIKNVWIECKYKNNDTIHTFESVNKYKRRKRKITVEIFNKHTNMRERHILKPDALEYIVIHKEFR